MKNVELSVKGKVAWEVEFIKTFYEVVKKENRALNKFNKNRTAGHRYEHGVKDLTEVHLQYLLFKELLRNDYFEEWHINIWDPLCERKHTKGSRQHADFTLTKDSKVDNTSPWIYLEMKEWVPDKVKEDYEKLREKKSKFIFKRGLLVYQFGRRPVNLVAKIEQSPLFKRLMKKFAVTTGPKVDLPLNVVQKNGNRQQHHFEAVLLTW